MQNAQFALLVAINNAQDETVALMRQDLIRAIGRGVGNTAPHEIAHTFLGQCCGMDALISLDANAAATSSDGDPRPAPSGPADSDPSTYTGFGKDGTPIHWESTTQHALQKCIAKGGSTTTDSDALLSWGCDDPGSIASPPSLP